MTKTKGDKSTSYISLSFERRATQPLPFSVRKLKRLIAPFLGKFSTLSQHEKEKPLLRGHCIGDLIWIPCLKQKSKRSVNISNITSMLNGTRKVMKHRWICILITQQSIKLHIYYLFLGYFSPPRHMIGNLWKLQVHTILPMELKWLAWTNPNLGKT